MTLDTEDIEAGALGQLEGWWPSSLLDFLRKYSPRWVKSGVFIGGHSGKQGLSCVAVSVTPSPPCIVCFRSSVEVTFPHWVRLFALLFG